MPTTAPPPENDPTNTYVSYMNSGVKLVSSLSPPSTKFTKLSNNENNPFSPQTAPSNLNNFQIHTSISPSSSSTISPNRQLNSPDFAHGQLDDSEEEKEFKRRHNLTIVKKICHENQTESKYNSRYFHAGAIFTGVQKSVSSDASVSQDLNLIRDHYPELARYVSNQLGRAGEHRPVSLARERPIIRDSGAVPLRGSSVVRTARMVDETTADLLTSTRPNITEARRRGLQSASERAQARLLLNQSRNRNLFESTLSPGILSRMSRDNLDIESLMQQSLMQPSGTRPSTARLARATLLAEESRLSRTLRRDLEQTANNMSEDTDEDSDENDPDEEFIQRIVNGSHLQRATLTTNDNAMLARMLAIQERSVSKKTRPPSQCEVVVEIDTIDEATSECSGTLEIKGLSDECKEYKSYFIGQIVDNSKTHEFQTRAWDAKLDSDKKYWSKFSEFPSSWTQKLDDNQFNEDLDKSKGVFMRWKEFFVEKSSLPDNPSLPVPSFSGFYYICLNKESGEIKGHYYADNIDKQEINLSYAGNGRRNDGRGNSFDEVPGPVFEWMD